MKVFAIIVTCLLIAGCLAFIVYNVIKIIQTLVQRHKEKKTREKGEVE